MRVVEATIAGAITAAIVNLIVARLALHLDRLTLAAMVFLAMFITVVVTSTTRRGNR